MRKSIVHALLLISLLCSGPIAAQTRTVAAQASNLFFGPDFIGCGPTVPTPFEQVAESWRLCIETTSNQQLAGISCPPLFHITGIRPLPGFPPIVQTADGPAAVEIDVVLDSFESEFCNTAPGASLTLPLPGSLRTLECPAGARLNGTVCEIDLAEEEDKDKAKGEPDCESTAGNPCNVANGNKFEMQDDYVGAGEFPIALRRFHNSQKQVAGPGGFGPAWRHGYSGSVQFFQGAVDFYTAYVLRPGGETVYFNSTSPQGPWTADGDVAHTLATIDQGGVAKWRLASSDGDATEIYEQLTGRLESITNRRGLTQALLYDASGKLQSVSDSFGRTLTFAYDPAGRISTATDPALNQIAYQYDAQGNLASVTYPGSPPATKAYLYQNVNFPHALTGIVDENGALFASWEYDSSGRAISSQHAGGAQLVTMSYPSASVTEVTTHVDTALSATRSYHFEVSWGIKRLTTMTGPACPSCGPAAQTYDTNGNVASRTDWNGNRTNHAYDARNLEISRVEALTSAGAPTAQTRTISTQWHATFRLPTAIAEPLRITTNVYDERGNLLSRSIQPTTDPSGAQGLSATPSGTPRTWTYAYNANGSILTIDGPRTDVSDITTYTYYANDDVDPGKRGNVATITNAAGHATSVNAYDAHGLPLTVADSNGVATTLTYDARLRLRSRTMGSESTMYDYDRVAQLTRVTLPNSSFLSFTYDNAHRLIGVQDNLGNRIAYTLDLAGNRKLEQVFDDAGQLARTRSRVFSDLNRLFRELGAGSQVTEYAYDEQGSVVSVDGLLGRVTSRQYDALNRLSRVIDPGLGLTEFAYDGRDALTQVTDARNVVTGYIVDGLGNLGQQMSPDSGTTTNTHDAAGNVLTKTDAKGQTTSYAYDALNRITLVTFQDGSKQTHAYDQGANGTGRLTSINQTDPGNQVTGAIAYAYDQQGRVTAETRTVGGAQHVLAYRYDSLGRLDQLTYPSGRTVSYAFDAAGRVNEVTTAKPGDTPQPVVLNVAYHPFGGVKSYALGNGQVATRGIDLDGRIASYTLGGQSFAVGYDAANRIVFLSDIGNPANSNTYGYDNLDRLTSAVLPATAYGYSYDAVGNRSSRSAGSGTDTYVYGATSNRLASITSSAGTVRNFSVDANGSASADGVNTYAYDTRGRMVLATSILGATAYQVNALGQRVRKINSLGDTLFHYDTRGRLIAESDSAGAMRREVIYLGDIPVMVFQ